MGLSGFIYVAIVLGWAVYLVPGAVRRYEDASRNRSVDRFSSRMRLLGRDAPSTAEADPPPAAAPSVSSPSAVAPGAVVPGPQRRAAARTAARRRRRVLLVLLLAAVVTAVAAALALVSWWAAVLPGGLVVVWLAACRGQARRESDVGWARDGGYREPDADDLRRTSRLEPPRADDVPGAWAAAAREAVAREAAAAVTGVAGPAGPSAPKADPPADPLDVAPSDEPTVVLEREPGDEAEDTDGGSLWDPVPVTLPTYVHKPRAHRTSRTVDLTGSDGPSYRRPEESAIYTHRVERVSRSEDTESASSAGDDEAVGEQKGPARRAVGE